MSEFLACPTVVSSICQSYLRLDFGSEFTGTRNAYLYLKLLSDHVRASLCSDEICVLRGPSYVIQRDAVDPTPFQ